MQKLFCIWLNKILYNTYSDDFAFCYECQLNCILGTLCLLVMIEEIVYVNDNRHNGHGTVWPHKFNVILDERTYIMDAQ